MSEISLISPKNEEKLLENKDDSVFSRKLVEANWENTGSNNSNKELGENEISIKIIQI